MPNCWLEIGLQPEGPATAKLDHFCSVVFPGTGVNTDWSPQFHVALHVPYAALKLLTSKSRPHIAHPILFFRGLFSNTFNIETA
jgi:hypothetical protein